MTQRTFIPQGWPESEHGGDSALLCCTIKMGDEAKSAARIAKSCSFVVLDLRLEALKVVLHSSKVIFTSLSFVPIEMIERLKNEPREFFSFKRESGEPLSVEDMGGECDQGTSILSGGEAGKLVRHVFAARTSREAWLELACRQGVSRTTTYKHCGATV